MKNINRVELLGNLVKDPIYSESNGYPICSFVIAMNRKWKTKEEVREETTFIRVTAWSKLAELAKENIFKGSLVYVEGRLHKDNRDSFEVVANDLIFFRNKELSDKDISLETKNE